MNTIPVLYLSSEAFSDVMAVSMISLLDNAHDDTYYDVHVLVEKIYSEKALIPFEELKRRYANFSLTWEEVGDAFSDTKLSAAGIGKETMYRLLAPELLPGVDKCIYLDSDTVILDDLVEMYSFDIGDNYIAGIYPACFLSKVMSDYQKSYGKMAAKMMESNMGLLSYDQYIGAGVMIMNLRQLRENDMTQEFLKAVRPNSIPRDQDILNTCCYGHIAKIPVKYIIDLHELNDMGWYAENLPEELPAIQYALKNPVVVHYADRFKPWYMFGQRYEKKWWNYAISLGLFETMWDRLMLNLGVDKEDDELYRKRIIDKNAVYQEAYKQFSQGTSYRIGRLITYIPRKIYFALRKVFK